MGALFQDLSYAARMMLKRPGFTLVAVLTLALGIGANSVIFSLMDAMLLNPLAYRNADRLVMVSEVQRKNNEPNPVSPINFQDWSRQDRLFEQVAAFQTQSLNLSGTGEPERVRGGYISASLFPLLEVNPALGRAFSSEENQTGKNRVAILSAGLWKRRFGQSPDVIGKSVIVNGESLTIVGVMPSEFQFPPQADKLELWIPIAFEGEELTNRNVRDIQVVARLRPDVSLKQAQAELSTMANQLEREYPDTNAGWNVRVTTLADQFADRARPAMLIMLAAVGFVLLIACVNVANLLLSRATARQKEIAIRIALGAKRSRLIRQLLTESVLLSLLSGAAGLLLAMWGVKVLAASIPDWIANSMPRLREIGLDWRILCFTLGVSLVTGVIFGLAPALFASNPDLNEMIKESGKGASKSFRGRRLANILVISEVALALVLLIGAGLMMKSLSQLQKVNPGFDGQSVLTFQTSLPDAQYLTRKEAANFYQQAIKRMESLPGVQAVGAINHLPMGLSGTGTEFSIEGSALTATGNAARPGGGYRVVTPNYFRALGVTVRKGRAFEERDSTDSQPVVIINETLAKRYWPNKDPLGQRLTLTREQDPKNPTGARVIVGVVGDVKHFGLAAPVIPEIYVPQAQSGWREMTFVVKTSSDPTAIAAGVKNEIKAIDKDLPVYKVRTMEEVMADSSYPQRLSTSLLGIFALIALVLAAVGIYAVISYSVSRRTHEIGIRMALGAKQLDVLRLIIRQGMKLAVVGVGIGLVIVVGLMRLMASLLYGVSATDPVTLGGVSLLLLIVAILACYLPARKAARVKPLIALRYE
jgi:predicted permease